MSVLDSIPRQDANGDNVPATLKLQVDEQLGVTSESSDYNPSEEESAIRGMVLQHFALGYTTMYRPRVEFNDLSVLGRDQCDFLAWNVYQPNNGDPLPGDQVNGWRSNAVRPIERNKAVSIAAHATARLLFPKIFAYDEASDYQEEAAQVMEDLMEWAGEQSDYAYTSLNAVIQALVSPASIVYTEHNEIYRDVKREKTKDGWKMEKMLDKDLSGFKDTVVRTDQFYIENFFEPDIQKQGWLIWRRVQDHRLMKEKYGHQPNWKFVRQGQQCLFNDANQGFYYVYDPNMRQYQDEEVLYWNKSMDVFLVLVNGVLVTDYDNPNPRWDKQYPFAKFGYELINSTCFYYKSLVFKVSHDASIINTLYPMIIDGTYLNIMPPFINSGGETIASDVIVPGQVTTLSSPDAQLTPIKIASDIKSGLEALAKVEESIGETSPVTNAADTPEQTAYQASLANQEKNVQLGLFVQMIGNFIKQFGQLRLNDILQNLTVADVDKVSGNPSLVYKTFLMNNKEKTSGTKLKKIKFDTNLSNEPMSQDDKLEESYKTLAAQGGTESKTALFRVNPELFRDLEYMVMVSPDVLNPRSDDVERLFMLETYDRAIMNPTADQEAVYKDLLLATNPKTAKNPDKYVSQAPGGAPGSPMGAISQMMQGGAQKPNPGQPGASQGASPGASQQGAPQPAQQPNQFASMTQ